MSFMDSKMVLADAQAITGTESSDYLDMEEYGATDQLLDRLWLNIRVGATAFNTCTGFTFTLQTDDDSAFGTPTAIIAAYRTLAQLAANAIVLSVCVPTWVLERYVNVLMTVDGSNPSTGAVDIWFGMEPLMHDLTIQKNPARA